MATVEQLQAGDVAGFNASRGERVDLFAEDLAGLTLDGVQWSNARLDKSDLTGTSLRRAQMIRASLNDVDGADLDLTDAVATGCKAKDAFLEGLRCDRLDATHADFSGATLDGASGAGVKLPQAKLKAASCKGVAWPGVDLSEAALSDAVFEGADLSDATVTSLRAFGLKASGANLRGWRGADVVLSKAQLSGVDLRGAALAGASFAGASLVGACLVDVDLAGADLSGADLTDADLTGACLAGAVLDDALFAGAKLVDADLGGIELSLTTIAPEQAVRASRTGALDAATRRNLASARAATSADAVAAFWLQDEPEEGRTLRWAVERKEKAHYGVLSVDGRKVLAADVLPADDGFVLLAVVARAAGPAVLSWSLSSVGAVGTAKVARLTDEVVGTPIFTRIDGRPALWFVGRRGPSVRLMRDLGEGFVAALEVARPVALTFLGRERPILRCKAETILPTGGAALADPVRLPDGFPESGVLLRDDDGAVWAAWVAPRKGTRDPGGLRALRLGGRGREEPMQLTEEPDVLGLDLALVGGRPCVAVVEAVSAKEARVLVADLAAGEVYEAGLPAGPFRRATWVLGGASPVLAISNARGALAVVAVGGEVRALFDGG